MMNKLDTPALLLDLAVVQRNTRLMGEHMNALGVRLRPHLKTAKSAKVADLATAGQFGGITVSTLKEAQYFLDRGYHDILYAVGIIPAKLDRVLALEAAGAGMTLITDSLEVAREMAARSDAEHHFKVMIEVDCGSRRAGVLPESDTLLAIGQVLNQAEGTELVGVLTHAGHSYHCRNLDQIKAVAGQERDGVVRAAQRLRDAGLPCPVVSAGSTPTAAQADDLSGITEMRPGVYVFYDLDQLAIGSCQRENLALSVLTSVIGHNHHAGHVLLDAGALALSKDLSATEFRAEVGYGEVCHPQTLAPYPGLFVQSMHQEHGMVPVPNPGWFEDLPVGARVRILPNHACMTAAAYDQYSMLEQGAVVDEWDRANG